MLTKQEKEKILSRERSKRWRERHPTYSKDYYANNKEKLRSYMNSWKRENRISGDGAKRESNERLRLKCEVMSHYSSTETLRCAMCGIEDVRILCIDHISGNGAEQRRTVNGVPRSLGAPFYRWLRRNNYPTGYQILCLNCNVIKRIEHHEYA